MCLISDTGFAGDLSVLVKIISHGSSALSTNLPEPMAELRPPTAHKFNVGHQSLASKSFDSDILQAPISFFNHTI